MEWTPNVSGVHHPWCLMYPVCNISSGFGAWFFKCMQYALSVSSAKIIQFVLCVVNSVCSVSICVWIHSVLVSSASVKCVQCGIQCFQSVFYCFQCVSVVSVFYVPSVITVQSVWCLSVHVSWLEIQRLPKKTFPTSSQGPGNFCIRGNKLGRIDRLREEARSIPEIFILQFFDSYFFLLSCSNPGLTLHIGTLLQTFGWLRRRPFRLPVVNCTNWVMSKKIKFSKSFNVNSIRKK